VCFDAKKPQSVYESHFVKDRQGNVTCVTLSEQECRYCYKTGHTVKFCPAVAANNAQKEKAENYIRRQQENEDRNRRQEKANTAAAAKAKMSSKGGFAALLDCDDSEDEQRPKKLPSQAQKKEEFPALGAPSKLATDKLATDKLATDKLATDKFVTEKPSFASALQKNPVQVHKEREEAAVASGFTVLSRNTNGNVKKDEPKMPSSMPSSSEPVFVRRKITNWADMDSDSDDEEEELSPNVTVRSKIVTPGLVNQNTKEEYVDNSAW